MMKKRILSMVLVLAASVSLAACSDDGKSNVSGSDQPAVNSSDSANRTQSEVSSSKDAWNPFVMQRQVLVDEGSMCGVVYLGYGSFDTYNHNFTDDRQYFIDIIKENGYADSFDFLLSVPDSHWVDTVGGSEFYLIIPADQKAHVEVNYLVMNEENNFEGETGENLYSADNGAPFLLKCNYSDIFPECEVIITDSNGDVLNWRPGLSLRDGTVLNTAQDGKLVYDFTIYPEGTKEED